MDAVKQLCISYPILQSIELTAGTACIIPTALLLITVQGAPFHINCRVLITLWTLAHLLEYSVVIVYVFRMAQYEHNEIPDNWFYPAERPFIIVSQLILATVGTFFEMGITLERAVSVYYYATYHSSTVAMKAIFTYFSISIATSVFLGSLMIEGPLTTAALASTFLLNCLDIISFVVREANKVANAMMPAYISGITIKVLSGILVWIFTFGIENVGLYYIVDTVWIILQLLNNGVGATFLLLKHGTLRYRVAALLCRRKPQVVVIPTSQMSANGEQYFEMLKLSWN